MKMTELGMVPAPGRPESDTDEMQGHPKGKGKINPKEHAVRNENDIVLSVPLNASASAASASPSTSMLLESQQQGVPYVLFVS